MKSFVFSFLSYFSLLTPMLNYAMILMFSKTTLLCSRKEYFHNFMQHILIFFLTNIAGIKKLQSLIL
jgi:hypothetical protein